MNTDRIKEIQLETAYPESQSVQQALLKVWNETQQESNNRLEKLVKQGEVSADVCEWEHKEAPREAIKGKYYKTSCEYGIALVGGINNNWYKHCPYCGKKIMSKKLKRRTK